MSRLLFTLAAIGCIPSAAWSQTAGGGGSSTNGNSIGYGLGSGTNVGGGTGTLDTGSATASGLSSTSGTSTTNTGLLSISSGANAGLTSIGSSANLASGSGGTGGAGGGSNSLTTTAAISTTNFLNPYLNNALYPGRPGSSNTAIASGSASVSSPTLSVTTNGANGRSSTTSTAQRFNGGSLGYVNTQVAFTAVLNFKAPVVPQSQRQAELQNVLARSSSLKSKDFEVSYENGVVVLKGKASDDEERRLAENLLRLEPGVHQVRNEVTVP